MSKCPFCGGPAPADTLPCTIVEAAKLTDESGRMKYSDKDGTWLLSVEGRTPRVHFASPGPDRWKERSRTLTGIAAAMAEQWGAP